MSADLYDEDDLKLIDDDWYLKRFLLAKNRNVDEAFKMLVETMQWRNEMYISQVRDFHFPIEFYKIGALFAYEPDKNGVLVVYMRIRFHRKTVELDEPTKGFLVHTFNKAEKLSRGQGFGLVFDLSGAGYSNLDLPFLSFLIQFGRNHFPGSLNYIIVYNLPWILSSFQKLVFSMLPAEATGIIKFASGSEIFKYIDEENAPDYITGGTCLRNYRAVAPGAKPIYDLCMQYGYTQETYDRLYPAFQRDLEDAEAQLSKRPYVDPPADFFDSIDGIELTPLPLPSRRVREPKKRPAPEEEENREIVTKKIRDMIPREQILTIAPSDHLNFVFDGKSYIAELDLKNLSSSFLAYKILSTNPSDYLVTPFKGILLPCSALRVTVRFLHSGSSLPSSKTKFRVVATQVKDRDMSAQAFGQLWTSKENDIISYRVRSKIAFSGVSDSSDLDTTDGSASQSSFGGPSDQLSRLEKRLRILDSKYSRLLVMLYALLLFSLILWVLVVAELSGFGVLKRVTKLVGLNLHYLQDTVCKLSQVRDSST